MAATNEDVPQVPGAGPATSTRPKEKPPGSDPKSSSTGRTSKRPTPPGLDADKHAAAQRASRQAEVLRLGFISASMAESLGIDSQFDAAACRVYLDNLLRDAGNPKDPVERLLVEQIGFAHLRLSDLHSQAARAESIDAAKVYNASAVHLMAEILRSALGLRAYRERTPVGERRRIAKTG